MPDLVASSPSGIHCPTGGFHIDPWLPVDEAVLTHAHGDHARAGSRRYHIAAPSLTVLRKRLGQEAELVTHDYGARFSLGAATVSLHPAGHVLGSAQVRIEAEGAVTVVSGDYKRAEDPTCAPFEVVPCDTFVTEATFALPIFRWDPPGQTAREILDWWDACIRSRRCAVLFCYSMGKAQRILAELARRSTRPVLCHGAIGSLVDCYRVAGVDLPATHVVVETGKKRATEFRGELVLAPPVAMATPWMRRFGDCETGFASGWMRIRGTRRRRAVDRGFVLSDHADWPALLDTIAATGARRVLATHGFAEPLARWLREEGRDAGVLQTSYEGESE